MLPSLHAVEVRFFGHNRVHHGHTVKQGLDFVWHPLIVEQYELRQLIPPPGRRVPCYRLPDTDTDTGTPADRLDWGLTPIEMTLIETALSGGGLWLRAWHW